MSPFAVQILPDSATLYDGEIWIPLLGVDSPERALVEMRDCARAHTGHVRLVEVDERGGIIRVLCEERHSVRANEWLSF